MSSPAIRARDISKQYRIGPKLPYSTLRESVTNWAIKPFRRTPVASQNDGTTIWALRDVSLEIQPGEVVGLIGPNGAGKSTLLKVFCRITEPTSGRAEIRGRIGALLEVATGFHPELSGRENIYLNGAILGMSRAEMSRQFDAIVAFADIEKFIDTPVKRYSSGMYVRLAFAVAAHLEPEILMVDEVLAVGDAAFQKKCLGKMRDVTKSGRTVVFVSHNMTAVRSLCTRAVWLDNGRLLQDGDSSSVVSSYLNTAASASTDHRWLNKEKAPGNESVRLRRASLRPVHGSPHDTITIRTALEMEFEYWNLEPGATLSLSVTVSNQEGVVVFITGPVREKVWHGRPFPAGLFRSRCQVPGDLLNDGTHHVSLLVLKDQSNAVYRHDDILVFDVADSPERRGAWYGSWPGAVRPDLKWTTERVDDERVTSSSSDPTVPRD